MTPVSMHGQLYVCAYMYACIFVCIYVRFYVRVGEYVCMCTLVSAYGRHVGFARRDP